MALFPMLLPGNVPGRKQQMTYVPGYLLPHVGDPGGIQDVGLAWTSLGR